MMSGFFYPQPTLNRLFNNCIKLSWHWISFCWNRKVERGGGGGDQIDFPLEKTTFKKPSLIRINADISEDKAYFKSFSGVNTKKMIHYILSTLIDDNQTFLLFALGQTTLSATI